MKILLVDDSKSARYALRLQLQRYGVEVEIAESAEAAFELLKGELPDAILMDHMMPGLNGFEALDIIRADPRTGQIPVVMCTSHEDSDFVANAQHRGAYGILPKSVAPEKLPELLSRLRAEIERQPSAARSASAPAPTAPPVIPVIPVIPKVVPEQEPGPDLTRLSEQRLGGLLDERIDSQLAGRLEALLHDLELGLTERLAEASRQRVESRCAELQEHFEARLASERRAADAAYAVRLQGELESFLGQRVGAIVPDLVRIEIEVERGQILGLVDQYLREFSNQDNAETTEDPLAGLDAAITVKAKEVARREASEAAEGAVVRAQQIADAMMQQVRTSLTTVYLAILGAALIGILAGAVGYFLPH